MPDAPVKNRKSSAAGLFYATLCGLIIYPLLPAAATGDLATLIHALGGVAAGLGGNLFAREIADAYDKAAGAGPANPPEWLRDVQRALATIAAQVGRQAATAEQLIAAIETRRNQPDVAAALLTLTERLSLNEAVARQHHDEQAKLIADFRAEVNRLAELTRRASGAGGNTVGDRDHCAPSPVEIKRYLTSVLNEFNKLTLYGIVLQGQHRALTLPLDEIYVPLQAECRREDTAQGSIREIRRIELSKVLSHGNQLVIIGGPGSGKTTVMSYLAYQMAHAGLSGDATLARRRTGWRGDRMPLPLLLPLAEYAAFRALTPDDTLAAYLAHYLTRHYRTGAEFVDELLAADYPLLLLLDGLDEIADDARREEICRAIEAFRTTCTSPLHLLVTCRTAAYRDDAMLGGGFQRIDVLPLEPEHIYRLIERVYQQVFPNDFAVRRDRLLAYITDLDERNRAGDNVEPLITSPLLARMLMIVDISADDLPHDRVALYKKTVDVMFKPNYTPGARTARTPAPGYPAETHRKMLRRLALALHAHGDGETGRRITHGPMCEVFQQAGFSGEEIEQFIQLTCRRSTLLEERKEGKVRYYRFLHLAFQEYLLAEYLAEELLPAGGMEALAAVLETDHHIADSWWREPVLLLAGCLAGDRYDLAVAMLQRLAGVDEQAPQRPQLPADAQLAGAELAAAAWQEIRDASFAHVTEGFAHRLAALLSDKPLLQDSHASFRAAAGNALGQLGDTRFHGRKQWYLPKDDQFGFIEIPAGEFLMGNNKKDDPDASDSELPRHRVELPAYYIGKYPVTVAQFRAFMEANPGFKVSDSDCLKGPANHPVVQVTWHEALAYCGWLTEMLRGRQARHGALFPAFGGREWTVTLPSEAEWEKAARGTEARRYPWGPDWNADRANCEKAGIGSTSTVGCFPGGSSPYGVVDMSGNVWEWTRSLYKKYPYVAGDGREDLEGDGDRVLRGGPWYFVNPDFFRCADRFGYHPTYWIDFIGFRCVLASPGP